LARLNQIKSNQITLFQASWPIANRQTDTHKHNKLNTQWTLWICREGHR